MASKIKEYIIKHQTGIIFSLLFLIIATETFGFSVKNDNIKFLGVIFLFILFISAFIISVLEDAK